VDAERRKMHGAGRLIGCLSSRFDWRTALARGLSALLLAHAVSAHEFGDDAGDSPAAAVPVAVGGGPAEFSIEIDTDEDWFVFTALPWVTYRIGVTNLALRDHADALRGRDALPLLDPSDTLPDAAGTMLSWSNAGVAAACYLDVRGFLEFTTGTYSLAVNSDFVDTDADGLLDRWETVYFKGLGQAGTNDYDEDGNDNEAEYYMLTNPTNTASALRITDVNGVTGSVVVGWQAVSQGWYRVWAASNLVGNVEWRELGVDANPSGAAERWFVDAEALSVSQRFYRIEFIY